MKAKIIKTEAQALLPQSPDDNKQEIPIFTDSFDEYFLWMAVAASIKSKDPKCQVGAVIVSADNLMLSTGYNGLARGIHDSEHILKDAEEKLKVICHAEHNAIVNAARLGVALHGATIYVTKFPCLACCNSIIQSGIKRIYTHDKAYWNDDPLDKEHLRKKPMLHQAKVQVDAPYHFDFSPKAPINPKKRKAAASAGAAGAGTLFDSDQKLAK